MRPALDGPIQSREQKEGRPTVNLELSRAIVNKSRGHARPAAASRRNDHLQALWYARPIVKGGPSVILVADPKRVVGSVSKSPRILQQAVHMFGLARLIRSQIGYRILCQGRTGSE